MSSDAYAASAPLYQVKAELFGSLGHPARIRVLELLADDDLPVHTLLSRIEIDASNLSQQLSCSSDRAGHPGQPDLRWPPGHGCHRQDGGRRAQRRAHEAIAHPRLHVARTPHEPAMRLQAEEQGKR